MDGISERQMLAEEVNESMQEFFDLDGTGGIDFLEWSLFFAHVKLHAAAQGALSLEEVLLYYEHLVIK